jgi:hypothetical protein
MNRTLILRRESSESARRLKRAQQKFANFLLKIGRNQQYFVLLKIGQNHSKLNKFAKKTGLNRPKSLKFAKTKFQIHKVRIKNVRSYT